MGTPQYSIKTGADSQLFFSREVTTSDVTAKPGVYNTEDVGLIKTQDVEETDVYEYPVLTRRTGQSIKGTTENIESNELRKGRTKSAPRKGNSSSEGDLEIELSPKTYDDIFEAALRGKWKNWKSDTNSATNFDKVLCADGKFLSKAKNQDGDFVQTQLIGTDEDTCIVPVSSDTVADALEVAELTCGTEDIKYSGMLQYGGITGQDLYQEFEHLAVNSMSLSVTPGQIVTGTFGFQGTNNPDLVGEGYEFKLGTAYNASKNYYTKAGDVYTLAKPQPTAANFDDGVYYEEPTELVKLLAEYGAKKGRFKDRKNPEQVKQWIADLANKTATTTDQFTAREGFMYINGNRVRYGSNLSFNLDNGLNRVFAIFEKDAISTSPLKLDITGSIGVYLIKDYTEKLHNMATGDKDVEIIFCFQNKEEDPDALYVIQIFKAKFESPDIGTGAEEIEETLNYTSFEERACRLFRIRRRKPIMVTYNTETGVIDVELSSVPKTNAEGDFKVTVMNGTNDVTTECAISGYTFSEDTKTASWTSTPIEKKTEEQKVTVTVEYNGEKVVSTYTIAVSE